MGTKKRTKDEIREGLNTKLPWLLRGVVAIYERQTSDEQKSGETRHHNKMGFSALDAPFLSSIAEQIKAGRNLSQKQIESARRCMGKYAGQLTSIANGKLAAHAGGA